jgi:hypothetical protein
LNSSVFQAVIFEVEKKKKKSLFELIGMGVVVSRQLEVAVLRVFLLSQGLDEIENFCLDTILQDRGSVLLA